MDYKRFDINDNMVAFVFSRKDLINKSLSDEIESLLPIGKKTILCGSRYLQMNGFKKYVKGIEFNSKTEKIMLCILGDTPTQVFASPSE